MAEPTAFFCGRWLPVAQLAIPYSDAGFVLGATVTEQLRTFGGTPFRLDDHIGRLARSLEIAHIDVGSHSDELAEIVREAVRRNHRLLAEGDDLGVGVFVTPGAYATFAPAAPQVPTLGVYTYPLPFALWVDAYREGVELVVSDIRQVPRQTLPPELKCRSRMHYYLADRRAGAMRPGARAVLLDDQGFVTETSTANLIMVRRDEGLISPPLADILPGISLMTARQLADRISVPFVERKIRPAELPLADEIILTGTSLCAVAAVGCDGRRIGAGVPGPVYRALLHAWSDLVGVDINAQAARFTDRA